jgi:hypothetical protein
MYSSQNLVLVLHFLQIMTQNPPQRCPLGMHNMTCHLGPLAFFLTAKLQFTTLQG